MGKSPRYRVLVVDDQRDLARAIRLAVASLGDTLEVIDAPSAEEALLDAHRHPVHVLIADLRLPGISGEELVRRIRQRHPQVKVFVVTGLPREEAQAIAEALQVEGLFLKPLEMADLLDAVERQLGLVESLGGEAPSPPPSPREQVSQRISDLLSNLRQELDLRSLTLIGESGRSLVRAGEWPEGVDVQGLVARLLAVLSAGNKVSHQLGRRGPRNLYVFPTEGDVLFMTTVGEPFALLAWCSLNHTEERLSQTARSLWSVAEELHQVLRAWGLIPEHRETGALPPLTAEPEEPALEAAEEKASGDLLELLSLDHSPPAPEEAEAFWESLVAEDPGVTETSADALSFEQAQRLGLVPPTEDEEA